MKKIVGTLAVMVSVAVSNSIALRALKGAQATIIISSGSYAAMRAGTGPVTTPQATGLYNQMVTLGSALL